MRTANCHPDRKHHSKGLCGICYAESRREGIRNWKATNKLRMLDKQRQYETNLPEEVRANWRLTSRFGISLNDYNQLFADQNGACKICQRKPKDVRLCVDHDHTTGKVRGLLCRNCNHIMHVFDNPSKLAKFLAYKGEPEC